MGNPWQDFEVEALIKLYPVEPSSTLEKLFLRSRESIKCKAQALGLRKHEKDYHAWTAGQLDLLRARYPDEKAAVLAAEIGVPVHAIYKKAYAFGLKKSAAFHANPDNGRLTAETGNPSRFKPGHTAWNKGKRASPWAASPRSSSPAIAPATRRKSTARSAARKSVTATSIARSATAASCTSAGAWCISSTGRPCTARYRPAICCTSWMATA
ncbi:MAG: hypothetical protein IPG66_05690 [Hydrogenophilales bacterium]|nr:hypothetical protein [Hydrogenophilales bacterium]